MLDNVIIIRGLDDIPNLGDVKFFLPVKCFDATGELIDFELTIYFKLSPTPLVIKFKTIDDFLTTFKSFLTKIPKTAHGSTRFVTKQLLP